ncbi:hypothetical protein EYF80_054545 [Liparis tanakae]|uniref:Uncharacterized protein n=1 Tax=Liparis tanakae TaxID=230148 RepID=A0A4Z2F3M6_9TELE|nr:hypothetical protein EYF80_054545 [Liparis tanakae]
MPRLNGSLRLPGVLPAAPSISCEISCESRAGRAIYGSEPGVYDTEVNVKYLKGALQGKSYIVSL